MKIKSRFSFRVLLPILVSALAFSLLYVTVRLIVQKTNIPFGVYPFSAMFLFCFCWAFFGELRNKAGKVIIGEGKIKVRGFLGVGLLRTIEINEVLGYTTTTFTTYTSGLGGSYEYLFIIGDKKKPVIISTFYHRNYEELKEALQTKTKFLGQADYSTLQDVKSIFSW